MRTIIQTIGPLYGESVNGSVFGQPNGSVARPAPNVSASVIVSGDSATLTFKSISGGQIANYDLEGITAEFINADSIVRIRVVIYDGGGDAIGTTTYPIGNVQGPADHIPTDGDTLTVVFDCYDSYNSLVAQSDPLEITAVVPEGD